MFFITLIEPILSGNAIAIIRFKLITSNPKLTAALAALVAIPFF